MSVPSPINIRLRGNEYVVYQQSGGFNYDGISFVGTHTLCITNLGKVLVYDTGGIFGKETCLEREVGNGGVIIQSYSDYGVQIKSSSSYPFSIDLRMSVLEFMKCFNEMPYECFQFPAQDANEIAAFVQYDHGEYQAVKLGLMKDQIVLIPLIGQSETIIPLHRVQSIERKGAFTATLHGFFDYANTQKKEVTIFITAKDKLEVILALWSNTALLSELTGPIDDIFTIAYSGWYDDIYLDQMKLILVCAEEDIIHIVDEGQRKILNTFHLQRDAWYYDSHNQLTVVLKDEQAHIIRMDREDGRAYSLKAWVHKDRVLYKEAGLLHGVYHQANYEAVEVFLLIDQKSEITIIDTDIMEVVGSSLLSELNIVPAEQRMIIIRNNEIAMMEWTDQEWTLCLHEEALSDIEQHAIGFTADNQPFFYHLESNGVVLQQQADHVLMELNSSKIKDIAIIEMVDEENRLAKVNVLYEQEGFVITLPAHIVPTMISRVYQQSKQGIVAEASPAQLYLSWARHTNDYALYHVFGQLFALQAGIEQIQEMMLDTDECNYRLLNFLYYTIQQQKRRLDQVSIYLPAMLEQNTRSMVGEGSSKQVEEIYLHMQQYLLSISSRIRQSLNEIEGALAPASKMLIAKADLEQVIKERETRGYVQSAVTAGIGAALMVGTGGLAAPLVLGGAFFGLNSYFTAKDARLKMRMDAQFDKDSLSFYMSKALDGFDHLMQTLLPYYIAEANRQMNGSFERLAVIYKPALAEPSVSQRLFMEMSQYYTFKQLPIDHSVMLPKKKLVETIQQSVALSSQHIRIFQQEVNVNVREQIESSTIHAR